MDSDRSALSGNSPRTKVHISRSGSIAIRNDGPPSPTRMSPQKSPSKKNIAGLKDAVNSLRIKAIRQYRTNESSKIVAADLGGATDQGIDTIEPSTPSTPSLSQNDVEKIAKFAARVSPDASIQRLSPEQRKKQLHHVVNVLHETVLDQRARAESRGMLQPH